MPSTRGSALGTWIGFLSMAFAVVGLTGVFGVISAPLARDRALARETALDDALATQAAADPGAALEALRPRLDDSAPAIIDDTSSPLTHRVAAERLAMRDRLAADATATDRRLLWLVCVVTVMGAAFGAVVLGAAARQPG